jgi:hypothetical protein
MTPQEELELRRGQYAARKDQAGYTATLRALEARIAELEAEIGE